MFDPFTLVAIGAASSALAAGAGVMATRAHVELVRLRTPIGNALRDLYRSVADEPVPAELRELLEQLPGDDQAPPTAH
ncbi:MAG TPA: NepR family anti-sigma factor [Allosphingosinicella sp.]|jgi:hypothetical protein